VGFVQQVGGAASTSGQTSFTTTATTFTAGNLLLAVVHWSYSGVGASVTVNPPAGWTSPLATSNNGSPNGGMRMSYLANNPGGSQSWTWTATMNGGGTAIEWAYSILEFSGFGGLDLTAVQGATGASSSTSLDTTAASGTTQTGDLLIQLSGYSNSATATITQSASSVPTSGWTVGTFYDGTSGTTPHAHCGASYQILATGSTVTAPHGIQTATVSVSNESGLLTFTPSAGYQNYRAQLLIYRRGRPPTRGAKTAFVQTPYGALAANQIFSQVLTATAVVTTASITKVVNKVLTATAVVSTATIIKQVQVHLVATAVVTTAVITKQVQKVLVATAVVTTASITKLMLKTLAAVDTTVAVIGKVYQMVLAATAVVTTASIVTGASRTANLNATAVVTTASITTSVIPAPVVQAGLKTVLREDYHDAGAGWTKAPHDVTREDSAANPDDNWVTRLRQFFRGRY
jgi:hypothetical protein